MSVTLYATIRPRPSTDAAGQLEVRQLQAGGEDYAAAKAAIDAQIPEGWQNLGYAHWPLS